MCVADEEVGGALGTGKIVEDGYLDDLRPSAAIVCDGSGIENGQWGLRIAAKGVRHLEITMSGTAAHGSRPERGKNAVLGMATALLTLNDLISLGVAAHPLLGLPTVAPGTTIAGGVAENVIPASCRATVDLRTIPGLNEDVVLGEIRAKVESAAAAWGCQATIRILREVAPVHTNADEPVVQDAMVAIRDVTGQDPVLRGLVGSNDARFLLARSIPTVIGLSPSDASLSRSHGTDESVGIAEVATAAEIYARAIQRWAERGSQLT
jgi:acetylornithine deacetylase/succinyl-diaminopimelate desuccinylase-like protein